MSFHTAVNRHVESSSISGYLRWHQNILDWLLKRALGDEPSLSWWSQMKPMSPWGEQYLCAIHYYSKILIFCSIREYSAQIWPSIFILECFPFQNPCLNEGANRQFNRIKYQYPKSESGLSKDLDYPKALVILLFWKNPQTQLISNRAVRCSMRKERCTQRGSLSHLCLINPIAYLKKNK